MKFQPLPSLALVCLVGVAGAAMLTRAPQAQAQTSIAISDEARLESKPGARAQGGVIERQNGIHPPPNLVRIGYEDPKKSSEFRVVWHFDLAPFADQIRRAKSIQLEWTQRGGQPGNVAPTALFYDVFALNKASGRDATLADYTAPATQLNVETRGKMEETRRRADVTNYVKQRAATDDQIAAFRAQITAWSFNGKRQSGQFQAYSQLYLASGTEKSPEAQRVRLVLSDKAPATAPAQAPTTGDAPATGDAMAQKDAGDKSARFDATAQTGALDFATRPPSDEIPLQTTNYAVPSGAIWVAPDGRGDGSKTAPMKLEDALGKAPDGATLVLRGGTYRAGDLVAPRRVTLQAAPGEKPLLKGSVVVSAWTREGNAWRHDGWNSNFAPGGYEATVLDKILDKNPLAANGDMVFVGGRALFQVASRELVAPGRFYLDAKAKQLWIGDDPTGHEVEATTRGSGLRLTEGADQKAAGSSVRGIGFAHYAHTGIDVGAPNVTVENCSFVWNGVSGLNFHRWAGGVKGDYPADGVVRGNICIGNGQDGATLGTAPRLLVEGNTFAYNNVEGFKRNWGAAGVKLIESHDVEIRDNVVEGNAATGIWMDIDMNGALVHHNTVRDNAVLGIFFEISRGCIIAFNTCARNSTGIQVSNSTEARVYNNLLVDNGKAFYAQWWKRQQLDGDNVAGIKRGEIYPTRDNVFVNNVVVTTTKKSAILQAEGNVEPSSKRLTQADYNAYYFAGEGGQTPFARWARDGGEPTFIASLDDFRALEPTYEAHAMVLQNSPLAPTRPAEPLSLRPGLALSQKPLPADIAALRRSATDPLR